LQADSSSTNGFKWGQVATAGIADAAVTAAKIASAVAGSGLAGGAGTALSVNVDDSTIEINSDTLRLKDSGVTLAKLASAVANALVPVGTIAAYAGVTAPTGWLLCNGTSTSGYTSLAALVGATTPDMRGRFPIGDNATLTLLGTGGSLTIAEGNLPSHSHTFSATSAAMNQNSTLSHTVVDGGHNHDGQTTNADIAHTHSNDAEGTTDETHTHNASGNAGSISAGTGQSTGSDQTDGMNIATAHAHGINSSATFISVNPHDVSHTHTVSGTTGTGSGSGTDYYPPHLVVNYIIKHD
jgi:microcystin-dependent protein